MEKKRAFNYALFFFNLIEKKTLMDVWTIQLAQWRVAKQLEIPLIDITAKSGNRAFAPSWGLLTDYKNHHCTKADYIERYYKEMRHSWIENRNEWDSLLAMPSVTLACYCKAYTFCHRHLLKEILQSIGKRYSIEIRDCGEITRNTLI